MGRRKKQQKVTVFNSETVMCIKTHTRTKNYNNNVTSTEFVFESGASYVLQNMHIVVPYCNREEMFRVSSLFLRNHFVNLAEWREMQIKSVLDE